MAVAVVAGFVLRAWVVGSVLGAPDLDEATVGLQAVAFRQGDLATFFQTQQYGGTLETAMVAVVTGVLGDGPLTLKVTAIVLHAVASLLVWRTGRHLCANRWAAAAGALLLWVGSSAVVWQSTKERGFYGAAIVLSAAALFLVVRLAATERTSDLAWLGLVVGLGVWTTPLLASALAPPVLWLFAVRRKLIFKAWVAIPGALIGAAPWLAWNLRNGWASLKSPPTFGSTFGGRLLDLIERLPVLVGTATPWNPDRALLPMWVTVAAITALLVVATIRTRADAPGLLATCTLGYGILQAFNGLAVAVGPDPRYLYPLAPCLVLTAACALDAVPDRVIRPTVIAAVALAAVLAVWGTVGLLDVARQPEPDQFLASPGLDDVISYLHSEDRTTAMTDATGQQLTYLSHGDIQAGSYAVPRFDELEQAGWTTGRTTYVLRRGYLGGEDQRLEDHLTATDLGFTKRDIGTYTVYLLDEPVDPPDVPLTVFGGEFAPGG